MSAYCTKPSTETFAPFINSFINDDGLLQPTPHLNQLLIQCPVDLQTAASIYLKRCVAAVCCKSARHWMTAMPYLLHVENRWV